MMKRFVAGIICVIMLTLCAGTGLAIQAKYPNTIAFIRALDDLELKYTVEGITEEGEMEQIKLSNQGEQVSYTINYFFNKDNTECGIRVWYILEYNDADFSKVVRSINTLNSKYKYCTWIADESDNTVTITWDIILRENDDVGAILTDATRKVVDCIDTGYEVLGIYAK